MDLSPQDQDLPPRPAVYGSHKARLLLQRGLQTTKLGVTEPLESLVIILAAVSVLSSPSLSASVDLSITLHGGIPRTPVSPRSTGERVSSVQSTSSKHLIRCEVLLCLAYLKSVCVFNSQDGSLISCMNLFFQ